MCNVYTVDSYCYSATLPMVPNLQTTELQRMGGGGMRFDAFTIVTDFSIFLGQLGRRATKLAFVRFASWR
jgi:hypothetical protein